MVDKTEKGKRVTIDIFSCQIKQSLDPYPKR